MCIWRICAVMQILTAEPEMKQVYHYLTVLAICSVFQAELAEHIPVIKTSVAGTRLIGRMTVGKLSIHSPSILSSNALC